MVMNACLLLDRGEEYRIVGSNGSIYEVQTAGKQNGLRSLTSVSYLFNQVRKVTRSYKLYTAGWTSKFVR